MAEPIHLHKPGELPRVTYAPSVALALQADGWVTVSAADAEALIAAIREEEWAVSEAQLEALRVAEEERRLAEEEVARLEAERLAQEASINATVAFMEPDATAIELEPETDGPTTTSADPGGDNRRRPSKSSKSAK